jgi:sulfopyruvate decarboxylase subunit alpha
MLSLAMLCRTSPRPVAVEHALGGLAGACCGRSETHALVRSRLRLHNQARNRERGPLNTRCSRKESVLDSIDARSQAIIDGLEAIDPEYVLHLPSSTLKQIINHFIDRPNTKTFPIPIEMEGVGILSGLVLGGRRAVMIIQDNGVGNMLTALATLPQAYHIPQFMIVSQRGGLGEYNSMIHHFCEHVEGILDAAQIRYFKLDGKVPLEQWASTVTRAYEYCQTTHRPVMVLCNLMGG